MALGTEFFDPKRFLQETLRGEGRSLRTIQAAAKTAFLFGETTGVFIDTWWKDVRNTERDPLVGMRQMTGWCDMLLRQMHVARYVSGRVPPSPTRSRILSGEARGALLVSNHRSYLDVLVIGSLVNTFMVGRSAVRDWPILGPGGAMAGIIYLDRSSQVARKRVRAEVRNRLLDGYYVLNFAEGVAQARMKLAPFKPGMFRAIAGLDLAIYPITLIYPPDLGIEWEPGGNLEAMSRGDREQGEGDRKSLIEHVTDLLTNKELKVSVHFGDPIECSGFAGGDALMTATRERMLHDLDRPVPWRTP